MPLTKTGKGIKKDFIKRYGKENGEDFFYATEYKHPGWRKDSERHKIARLKSKWNYQKQEQWDPLKE